MAPALPYVRMGTLGLALLGACAPSPPPPSSPPPPKVRVSATPSAPKPEPCPHVEPDARWEMTEEDDPRLVDCVAAALEEALGATRTIEPIVESAGAASSVVRWSAEGKLIAVSAPGEIALLHRGRRSTRARIATRHPEVRQLELRPCPSPAAGCGRVVSLSCDPMGACAIEAFDLAGRRIGGPAEVRVASYGVPPVVGPTGAHVAVPVFVEDGFAVELRELDTGKVRRLSPPKAGVFLGGLAFSPDGRSVAMSYPDGAAVFDVGTGRRRLTVGTAHEAFEGSHEHSVGVAFAGEGALLVTASHAELAVWSATTGRRVRPPAKGSWRLLATTGGGTWAQKDTELHRVEDDGSVAPILTTSYSPPVDVAGGVAAWVDIGAGVRIGRLRDGAEVATLPTNAIVDRVRLSPDGRQIALSALDAPPELWSLAPPAKLATLQRAAHARGPEVLAMSSSTLVTWSEGKLMVWDLEERARRLVVEAPPIAALAGDRLAFVDGGDVVLEGASRRVTIPVAGVRALELSRDGEHVVIATADAVLRARVDGSVQWRADVASPLGLYLRHDGHVVTARGELDAATGVATPSSGPDAGGTWLKQGGAVEAFGGVVCRSGRFPETGFDFLDQFAHASIEGGVPHFPVAIDATCRTIAAPPGDGPTTLYRVASFAVPDTGRPRRGLVELWLLNGESLLARQTEGPRWGLLGPAPEGLRCRIGERVVPNAVCAATRDDRLLAELLGPAAPE